MGMQFPSREFDEAVAAVCHGVASDQQMVELNVLLHSDRDARDEYIVRLELHSRLASSPDLFLADPPFDELRSAERFIAFSGDSATAGLAGEVHENRRMRGRVLRWALATAIGVALLVAGQWGLQLFRTSEPLAESSTQLARQTGVTSTAVAMLNRVVDPQWDHDGITPRLESPLEPGRLKLDSGLAEVVFYSGARVVIEGPAEFQIVSSSEASCQMGRFTAEVPEQAHGFQLLTPHGKVSDVGTEFGLEVTHAKTELHVFKGNVQFSSADDGSLNELQESAGVVAEHSRPARLIAANSSIFTSLFDFQERSTAAGATRYGAWRELNRELNYDSSLRVHFDFESPNKCRWRLSNASLFKPDSSSATIVGCRWSEGRWPGKSAIEFYSVNDRIRLSVPGKYDSLTLATWVRVQGLDRKLNSLFMCDGFDPGTVHWLLRRDGVLGLTVVGSGSDEYQIAASPSVVTLDQFGMWLHLAVVLDSRTGRIVHYVNGRPVAATALKIKPPYRIGTAELGNWKAEGFPKDDPFMIRNFSGAMDEFCLFGRALNDDEIRGLYAEGKPHPEPQQDAE